MRLVSLIVTMVVAGVLTFYVLTCSVNNAPPAPVHPIVGKWQLIVMNGHIVSPELYATSEYTPDGTLIQESNDPKNGYRKLIGSYTINENVVHTHYKDIPGVKKNFECDIAVLSSEKLVFTASRDDNIGDTTTIFARVVK